MGDYSRDPRARLDAAVSKHYVGVRLQQGVPLLDADWNELEDLRRHELASLVAHFIGDGVPSGNEGFRVDALPAGGVDVLVVQAAFTVGGASSLTVDFDASNAADVLGFLPSVSVSKRAGAPARLVGQAAAPFALFDGATLALEANGGSGEAVTFDAADFDDISQAQADEVAAVMNDQLGRVETNVGEGNDFLIVGGDGTVEGSGRMLVEGTVAVIEQPVTYTMQPLFENPELASRWGVPMIPSADPPEDGEREDLVYLDVWDREVDAVEDNALILPAVGVETAVRLRREWAVRLAPGAADLTAITRLSGHRYGVLARIRRTAGEPAVADLIDERSLNVTVSRYLKRPIHARRGARVLDVDAYASIMEGLRDVLTARLRRRVFDFSWTDEYDRYLLQSTLTDLAQQANYAALQARTINFDSDDAFYFLGRLYELQRDLLEVVDAYGNEGDTADTFIEEYTRRLDGDASAGIEGLEPALHDGDIVGAAQAQEAINSWLSLPVDILPEGDVQISIESVEPEDALEIGTPLNVSYRIRSFLNSPQEHEAISLEVTTASATTWTFGIDTDRVELEAAGGEATVTLTVTPRTGAVEAVFRLTATVERNPTLVTTHESAPFVLGSPPPTAEFLVWDRPERDDENRAPFPQQRFEDGAGQVSFGVTLVSTSDSASQTFEVSYHVVPPEGEEEDWHPTEDEASSPRFTVPAGSSRTLNNNLFGPTSPDVGTEGILVVVARRTAEDDTPEEDPPEQRLEYTFVVT